MGSSGEYFVILYHQKDEVRIPLTDEHGSLQLFATFGDAEAAGAATQFGEWFGVEVFRLGWGES